MDLVMENENFYFIFGTGFFKVSLSFCTTSQGHVWRFKLKLYALWTRILNGDE